MSIQDKKNQEINLVSQNVSQPLQQSIIQQQQSIIQQQKPMGTSSVYQPKPFEKKGNKKEDNLDVFNVLDDQNGQQYPTLAKILDSNEMQIVVTILTVFALYGSDVVTISVGKNGDTGLDTVTLICLAVFSAELVMSWLVKEDYRYSFFFWLDLISTLSLILDLQMFQNVVFFSNKSANTAQLARAGRASRIGTRAGRVVRLVRLIRIAKLYKQAQTKKEKEEALLKNKLLMKIRQKSQKQQTEIINNPKEQENQDVSKPGIQLPENGVSGLNSPRGSPDNAERLPLNNLNVAMDAPKQDQIKNGQDQKNQPGMDKIDLSKEQSSDQIELDGEEFKESRVSKRLSELTTKRVIIVVFLLVLFLPMFQSDYFYDLSDPLQYSLSAFSNFCTDPTTTNTDILTFYNAMSLVLQGNDAPLIQLSAPFTFTQSYTDYSVNINELRNSDLDFGQVQFNITGYALAHSNETDTINYLNSLTYDDQVVKGVLSTRSETIIEGVLSISQTTFICIVLTLTSMFISKDANDLALRPIERMMKKVNEIARNPLKAKEQQITSSKQEQEYETTIIENAIVKIGALLALGFGDAGSEIIGQNMKQVGNVNPMIPGRKRVGIYGFCDIRNFTDATEQLQKDVMLFVNNIGEIVHSFVDRYNGAANKNIGDAFLLVWKFSEDKAQVSQSNVITLIDKEWVQIQADFAAISFIRIQAQINRRPNILAYRKDVRLTSRMPGYKVKIGYGLHFGWSIEGAIGSEFKIDASYLSPNVNMASKLEGGTKAYGVPILLTSFLTDLFTPGMSKLARQIDNVTVKGFQESFGLYTFDMKPERLPEKHRTRQEQLLSERNKKLAHAELLNEKAWDAWDYCINCVDVRLMCFEEQKYSISQQNIQNDEKVLKNPLKEEQNHDQIAVQIDSNHNVQKAEDNQKQDFLRWNLINADFRKEFDEGFQLYQKGLWQEAKVKLEHANHILSQKGEPEDAPVTVLIDFMQSQGMQAPVGWTGIRESYDL